MRHPVEKTLIKWDLFSVFPVYAGVIPATTAISNMISSFPRIRGGDPVGLMGETFKYVFSPYTRG